MEKSFITTNRFFDNKNYPRGFSRHGDFTIREAQLLECYGQAFNELNLGKRQPITEEEKNFLSVCRGKRKPSTELERVWIKYISRINCPKRFYTLSGTGDCYTPSLHFIENYTDNED